MRYIRYHGGKTHLRNMGKKEIEAFLSQLAVQQKVAASTQRQALNAIVFLYKKVLDTPVDENLEPVRAKRHPRPPVVLAQSEVANVFARNIGVLNLERLSFLSIFSIFFLSLLSLLILSVTLL